MSMDGLPGHLNIIIYQLKNNDMKTLKIWWDGFWSKTPAFWNWIKTVCGWVPVILSAINVATSGMLAPTWFTNSQFYIAGAASVIIIISQSQTKGEVAK